MVLAPSIVPILSAGRHRSPRSGACFMEFASYLAGEKWSDRPACTDPALAALARDVNDLCSDEGRAALTPLIHRVVGLTSDDPRFAATVAFTAASAALPIASMERQRALAVGLLALEKAYPGLPVQDALAQAPGAERWARSYLVGRETHGNGRALLNMIHTSAVGIAKACVEDPDARLAALLENAIAAAEQVARPVTAAGRTLVTA